ncbi:MAG: voltage-gated chloride channel protein [Bacteriovoracaceae bacterium]|nr:voltage-gated chloride channel protein [Bacteriovoracaceae bacterium]
MPKYEAKRLKSLLFFVTAAILIGSMTGVISALFIRLITWSISFRKDHEYIIFFLPLVGFIVLWVYKKFGNTAHLGNNLILDEIHKPQKKIPLRMVPFIFISTILSHLFGASVGREGAAVQMGGGISEFVSSLLKVSAENRRLFLMMGMSSGFAAVFGTPVTGAIFGIEVLFLGAIAYEALIPCLLSSIVGYYTTLMLGVSSAHYFPIDIPHIELRGLIAAIIAGIFFGYTAKLFIWSVKKAKSTFAKIIKNNLLHPVVGGILLICLFYLIDSDRYHSLGEEIIHASFRQRVYPWDFLGKIFSTSLSLGSGFKGGEVLSLFYIGSTLGNTLSFILPLEYPVLAALGFVSVFAGAANTPISCFFLAFELFGSGIGLYSALAISISYLFSGKESIYSSQPTHNAKIFD